MDDRAADRRPLPDAQEVETELLDLMADWEIMASRALVDRVVERLGYERDVLAVVRMVEVVEERLVDWPGPLAWVTDRAVYVAGLRHGIVLTHAVTEVERERGELPVSFDLAGFERIADLSLDGHRVECVVTGEGSVSWVGPEGWLAGFAAGTVLAVRVDDDGAIGIEPLGAVPASDAPVVAAVRRACEEAEEDSQLPASGEQIVLGMLVEDRAMFDVPRPPLGVLCEAAGLDRG